MAKVVKFPIPTPEKFGPQRVQKKKDTNEIPLPGQKQLNLFTGGRVVSLHQLTAFEEALILDEQGDYPSARARYLQAVEKGDAVADAYCNLGILEFSVANTAKAIDYFTLSLKNDPRHSEAHYNLANLYAEVGNTALAKLHYQTAIEIDPAFPNSYFNLGLTLAINKEFPAAVDALNHYRQLTPGSDHRLADDLIEKLTSHS